MGISREGTITIVCILIFGAWILSAFPSAEQLPLDTMAQTIGESFANWSLQNQKTIKINGNAINRVSGYMWSLREDMRCDGSATIEWDATTDRGKQRVREQLISIIQLSECNRKHLVLRARALDTTVAPEELAEEFKCLGRFDPVWPEFLKGRDPVMDWILSLD